MIPFLGAGAVVSNEAGALLLVVETGGHKQGLWSLPAGKVEPGERFADAMQREVNEETGLTVAAVNVLGLYHSVRTDEGLFGLNVVFRATRTAGEPTATAEHPEVRFVSRSEIDTMLTNGVFRSGELMRAVLADLDAGRSLPLSTVRALGEERRNAW